MVFRHSRHRLVLRLLVHRLLKRQSRPEQLSRGMGLLFLVVLVLRVLLRVLLASEDEWMNEPTFFYGCNICLTCISLHLVEMHCAFLYCIIPGLLKKLWEGFEILFTGAFAWHGVWDLVWGIDQNHLLLRWEGGVRFARRIKVLIASEWGGRVNQTGGS